MTRDFSNRRRDDMRPAPRNMSSGRYREEQPSRPMRPRLSRDTVDRAWENGANRRYADYRSRPPTSTPHDQRQGRPSPRFEHSRPPYEQSEYERRQGEQRPYERRQGGYRAPSSFDRNRPPRERRFAGEPPRHTQESGYRAQGTHPGDERWTRHALPRRESEREGYREHFQNERPPRSPNSTPGPIQEREYRAQSPRGQTFDRPARPPYERNGPRAFERTERSREDFVHGRRPGGASYPQRNVYNPRWQSRPAAQRQSPRDREPWQERPPFQQARRYDRPGEAQFEGDYEHFATEGEGRQPVTHQPDGRTFKSSPAPQRKAARFWTDVEEETTSLLTHSPAEPEEAARPSTAPPTPAPEVSRPRKQPEDQAGKVKMVKTTRASNQEDGKAKASKKKAQPRGPVIYPSQRGYKWPASGQ